MPDIITTVILVILLLFILRGAWRGVTGELAPLGGLVACGGIIWFGYTPLKHLLTAQFPSLQPDARTFYAALAILLLGGLFFFLVAKLIKRIGEWAVPQPFNAILGGLIGGVKAFVLISLVTGSYLVIRDKVNQTLTASEENPLSAAALTFWKDYFLPDMADNTESLIPHLPPATSETEHGLP